MKNLNRKEYKKIIKEFRKECPIAQVQHKWVYVLDEAHNPNLIYVYGSIIKRVSSKGMSKYHSFKYGDYLFKVVLYGSKSVNSSFGGVEFKHCYSSVEVFDNDNKFQIVSGNDIEDKFDLIYKKNNKRLKYFLLHG